MNIPIPLSFRQRPYAARQFQRIATWAFDSHPYYRDLLPGVSDEVPILTRTDFERYNDKLLNGHPGMKRTSGSTGIPVEIHMGPGRLAMEDDDDARAANWLGGRKQCVGIRSKNVSAAGAINVSSDLGAQVDYLRKRYATHGDTVIISYPSNFELLASWLLDEQEELPFIERIMCQAEQLQAYQEDLIRRAFPNAYIGSSYSSAEHGLMAMRCPHNPDFYHIMAHKIGIEILDDDGAPCELGEVGRVVITDYFNRRMPLLRYEIGDLAATGECDCGAIATPSLCKLIGKLRHNVLYSDGKRRPFTPFAYALRGHSEIRRFQLIQHAVHGFDLHVVGRPGLQPEELRVAIQTEFSDIIGTDVSVALHTDASMEREPSGKFFIFKSLVEAPRRTLV